MEKKGAVKKESVSKELFKTLFEQIKNERIASAKTMVVFAEACWLLKLEDEEIEKIIGDFIPLNKYLMDKEKYEKTCKKHPDFKHINPTLESVHEGNMMGLIMSVKESLHREWHDN